MLPPLWQTCLWLQVGAAPDLQLNWAFRCRHQCLPPIVKYLHIFHSNFFFCHCFSGSCQKVITSGSVFYSTQAWCSGATWCTVYCYCRYIYKILIEIWKYAFWLLLQSYKSELCLVKTSMKPWLGSSQFGKGAIFIPTSGCVGKVYHLWIEKGRDMFNTKSMVCSSADGRKWQIKRVLLFDTVTKQRAISTQIQCEPNRLCQLFVVLLLQMIHVCTHRVTHIDQTWSIGGANSCNNRPARLWAVSNS